jgi:hypothetical protein
MSAGNALVPGLKPGPCPPDSDAAPLTEAELHADAVGCWYEANREIRDRTAAGITGMDVPTAPWTAEDVAYWTGTARYEPWRDVAALFRTRREGAP